MTAPALASKYRRALRNKTGVRFTADEIKWLADSGIMSEAGVLPKEKSPTVQSLSKPWPQHEVVYFIGPINGPVKIGYASDFGSRFRHLRYMSPEPLHVWAFAPGTMKDEQCFHTRFASTRIHGEWFQRSDELEVLIESLRVGVDK